jgi:integrase
VLSKTKEAPMTPRKASLRVAHASACPNASKTALDSIGRGSGCTCEPSFYTFHRDREGRPVKGPRVKDRRVAERALTKEQFAIDEGRAGIAQPKRVTFGEWADRFEEQVSKRVARGELKPRTLTAYAETLELARESIGTVPLREIGATELRSFYEKLPAMRPASRDRHVRHLSVCLSVAVDDELLDRSPVPAFRKKLKLKLPKRGKAPFEDGELVAIWKALADDEPVFLHAAQLAAEAGLRIGELAALDWSNVSVTDGRIRVESTWDCITGQLVAPKNSETRTLYLTNEARQVIERWVRVAGVHEEGLVFPNPGGGRLSIRWLQRAFARAMKEAGVPKEHPELRLPRSFHSLRYSTSVLMQRRGYHPRLIEQTLGHGSLELTYGVYGGWTPEQLAAEATREVKQ